MFNPVVLGSNLCADVHRLPQKCSGSPRDNRNRYRTTAMATHDRRTGYEDCYCEKETEEPSRKIGVEGEHLC